MFSYSEQPTVNMSKKFGCNSTQISDTYIPVVIFLLVFIFFVKGKGHIKCIIIHN